MKPSLSAADQHNLIRATGFEIDAPALIIEHAVAALHLDASLLAVFDGREPRSSKILFTRGIEPRSLDAWCAEGHQHDDPWRQARLAGEATVRGSTPSSRLFNGHPHAIFRTQPASLDGSRVWIFAGARREGAFTETDERLAALALRLQQVHFDHVGEPGMGRLIMDADHDLIHADPRCTHRLGADPALLQDLAGQLGPVIRQRWPHLANETCHDIILPLWGQATWVRFCDVHPHLDLPRYRVLELRPVTENDAPAVGLVNDERIARSLAYLTDHFVDSPTLNRVAEAAGVSSFHFHRLFTREVGTSPKHYLLRFQLQTAKWLLRTTQLAVGTVAARAGFSSHGHFTATFHRIVGMNPSRYRETAGNAPEQA